MACTLSCSALCGNATVEPTLWLAKQMQVAINSLEGCVVRGRRSRWRAYLGIVAVAAQDDLWSHVDGRAHVGLG